MKIITSILLLATSILGTKYTELGAKAYLLENSDLRIITSEGSVRLPLFGFPATIVIGTRPFVLTSEAVFSVDPGTEQISAVFRLDRNYTDATIGANDRIYLLGGDVLTVIQGGADRMSILYTYGLPGLASHLFMLPNGHLFIIPPSGQTAFSYDPNNKKITNVTLPWIPAQPLMFGSILVSRTPRGLAFFNAASKSSTALDLGAEPTQVTRWKGKILVSTSSEMLLVDPLSSAVTARSPIAGIFRLSALDSEHFATVISGNDLITVNLPSLVPADTFNASCNVRSAAYPFLGQPLFVCGDKLALPGGSAETGQYMVQPVAVYEGQAFSLQVGAFSNPMSFGPLMEGLARQGLPYYFVEEGGLTRFRVGFFRTREEADRIRPFLPYDSWVVVEQATRQLTFSIHDMNRDRRPDGIVARADSVLIITLRERAWIEILKVSKLPAPVNDVYLKGNRAYAQLEGVGLRELVLPDSVESDSTR